MFAAPAGGMSSMKIEKAESPSENIIVLTDFILLCVIRTLELAMVKPTGIHPGIHRTLFAMGMEGLDSSEKL